MNADKLADALRYAVDNPDFDSAEFDRRARAALAEHDAQPAQGGNSLLIGTTPDGRPYGLHGTKESVEIVSDMIAAYEAQPVGVPDGWVMVPELPDARMLDAAIGVYAFADEAAIDVVWRAMLAAAPQPPAQPSADTGSVSTPMPATGTYFAQPSADAEEWTDRQCIEFMSVGLRHVRYADVKGAGPTCDEIRQGVRAARAAEGRS